MTEVVTIRDARPSDEAAIVRIVRPDTRPLGPLRRYALSLTAGPLARSTFVAVDGDRIVGVLRSGVGGSDGASVVSNIVRSVVLDGLIATVRSARGRTEGYRARLKVPTGSFEVRDVHVAPSRRGEGIGDALLAEAERRARAADVDRLALLVRADNPAKRLYERVGYVVTDEQADGGPEVAARLLMTKELRP